MDLITYETIYEFLRKEKYEAEIQKLPSTFFNDIINYLKEKKSILEAQKSQDSIFSKEYEKTGKQIQNIRKIIQDVYDRRENKIIQLALFTSKTGVNIDSVNLLKEEEEMYLSLVRILKIYREGILENLLALRNPHVIETKDIKKENKEDTKLVKFLYPVPKFMGEDLNIYGPFNFEDVANLPPKVAQLLINKRRAREIKS